MATVRLPDDPSLEQLRKQAKDLRDGARAGASSALELIGSHHPNGPHRVTLTGADEAGNIATVRCPYTVLPAVLQPTPVIAWKIDAGPAFSVVRRLIVRRVPAQAAVSVTCRGSGCPFKAVRGLRGLACHGGRCRALRRRRRRGPYTLDLSPLLAHHSLPAGTRLTVSVTAPSTTGRVLLLTLRAGHSAAHRLTCLAPGSSAPGRGCRLTSASP